MSNSFAYLVLVSWPLVTLVLFRRLPLPQALAWSIVAGYLLLPIRTGWNFPMVPAIDKNLVLSVSAAIMALIAARQERLMSALPRPPGLVVAGPSAPWHSTGGLEDARGASFGRAPRWMPQGRPGPVMADAAESPQPVAYPLGRRIVIGLLLLAVLVPFATVLANLEPLSWGPRTLPGLRPYDGVSAVSSMLVRALPFIMAMMFLATPERHGILLKVLATAGVGYAALALIEVRLSPQLNIWVYGFFPHSWLQHVRDGFRPVVFMQHGLWLGIFLATATLAACTLWQQAIRERIGTAGWLWGALWIGGVLVLSRNFGATFLVLVIAPVIVMTRLRTQVVVAAVVAASVLSYPMLRGAGLVPTDAILSGFSRISPDRADSLGVRITNENRLLAHANEKPLTGWGGWGRNRVYDDRGRDISITDGAWIITLGTYGWLGYIAQFGLLALPTILIALRRREVVTTATAGLMLIMCVNLVDLLPNATSTPLTWLIGGAIAGRVLQSYREARLETPRPGGIGPAFGAAAGMAAGTWAGGHRPVFAGAANGTVTRLAAGVRPVAPGASGAVGMNGTRVNGKTLTGLAIPADDGMQAALAAGKPRHQRRPRG